MFVLLISGSQDHFRGEMEQISLLFIIPMMLIIITSGTFNKKQISNKYSTAIYSLIAVIIYGYISVTYGVGNSIIEKSLAQSHISRKNAELTLNFNACGPFIQDNYPIYHTSASACTVKEVNIIHHEKGDKYVIDYTRSDGSIRRIDIDEKYVFTSSKAISPSLSR
jgi:hypothetical protein